MSSYGGDLKIIYDFQTIIAGFSALGAALLATRYSRQQMKLSTRDLLIGRGTDLAKQRQETRALFTTVYCMQRDLRPWEQDMIEPEPTWAHSAEHSVGAIVSALQKQQNTSLDGSKIDSCRKDLVSVCEVLSSCLRDIHAVVSMDFGGFEEPPVSEKPAYAARAALACRQIEDRLAEAVASAKSLESDL